MEEPYCCSVSSEFGLLPVPYEDFDPMEIFPPPLPVQDLYHEFAQGPPGHLVSDIKTWLTL